MMSTNTLPLSMVRAGENVKLIKILAEGKLVGRLSALGFTPGTVLRVVQDHGGPLLINVRDSRIAIGRGMAHKILVAFIDENEPANQSAGTDQEEAA